MGHIERCEACGEPVSVNDEGGCVGAGPHWHFRAECLLEAARREHANYEGAVEAWNRAYWCWVHTGDAGDLSRLSSEDTWGHHPDHPGGQ